MLTWPKPPERIADRKNGNGSFWNNRGANLMASLSTFRKTAVQPASRPLDLEWLEGEFRDFNAANGYPLSLAAAEPTASGDPAAESTSPSFEVTRRYMWETSSQTAALAAGSIRPPKHLVDRTPILEASSVTLMRVGIVLDDLDRRRGGMGEWCWQFVNAVANRPLDLHVIAQAFGVEPLPAQVTLHPVERSKSREFFAQSAASLLKSFNFDVVHDMGVGWHFDLFQPHGGSHAAWEARRLDMYPRWFRASEAPNRPLDAAAPRFQSPLADSTHRGRAVRFQHYRAFELRRR